VRVGILATHPVQYAVPWYRALAKSVDLQVFYCHRQTAEGQARAGFGVPFEWDVDLFQGYSHEFLENRARVPDVSAFRGCDTPDIKRIIRRERFDAFVVHGWATRSFWQAMVACWGSGTPILVRGDSQRPRSRGWPTRLAKYPLYRGFIPRFDGYLVVGERAREYLAHYGADPRRMFFSPHAVDNAFFASAARRWRPARADLRARWSIPAGATIFLFVGKFIPKKRPADFAQAVGLAAAQAPNVWGLMVGDGPLRPTLEAMVRQHGWPVRFAGFLNQTEVPGAYAACDALVMTSTSEETWGLVVNEAMATGLPAVVGDQVGCVPDLVRPGETGDVFPTGAVPELAARLAALAAEPVRLAEMGDRASRLVDEYSVDRAVEGTLAALRSVAGRAAGATR
jgi:glycosyltransferase involved in cell wall biosynthesis